MTWACRSSFEWAAATGTCATVEPVQNVRQVYLQQLRFAFGTADCLAFNGHSVRDCCLGYFEELGIEAAKMQVVLDIGVTPPASRRNPRRVRSRARGAAGFRVAARR